MPPMSAEEEGQVEQEQPLTLSPRFRLLPPIRTEGANPKSPGSAHYRPKAQEHQQDRQRRSRSTTPPDGVETEY